jgi:hypothetical protein
VDREAFCSLRQIIFEAGAESIGAGRGSMAVSGTAQNEWDEEMDEIHVELLIAELLKLSFLLRVSKVQFKPDADDHGRSGARDALIAAIRFISEALPHGTDLVVSLNQLLYALKDLDAGQVVPLLQPAKINNRPAAALATRLFRSMAAVLMELNQQAGLPRREAAERAARELNGLGYRDEAKQRITATQVENWRDNVKAPPAANDQGAQRYSLALEELQKLFPNKPQEAAKFLLDALPGLEAPTIPRKLPS